MKGLSYRTLEEAGYTGYLCRQGTERVLQFGEGNFLRAFVDYFIDIANEKTGWGTKVVAVQPIAQGRAQEINGQEGLYTVYLRGLEDGKEVVRKRIVSCVSKCLNPYKEYQALMAYAASPDLRYLVSNTTEAGNRRSMDLTFIRFVKQTLAKSDKENFRNDDTCKYCTYEKYCQSI